MTTLKAAVKAYLQADTPLMSILTGGIYDADDFGRDGFNRDNAPNSFDATTDYLLPTAVLKWTPNYPYGPHYNGQRRFLEIYLYEHDGYLNIDLTIAQLTRQPSGGPGTEFMHRKVFGAYDDVRFAGLMWNGNLGEATDDTIDNGASMNICRFLVSSTRV